ncbi:HAD domain-containing protein [Nocardia sp. BMG51109]|uniref:HAD domain-containing protein n=1 Tax=Nocardia sp. BMG51109 TaxID=1056816 RepID=UPI0004AD208C|nr:HAD domain-containing protein [Nocardia sp. BMG51109]
MAESSRAAILLDVDGPLNPAARQGDPPPGYRPFVLQHQIIPAIPPVPHRVLLNPDHGSCLLALASDADAELVWATAWEYEANRLIGPVLGLPRLDVIELEEHGIRHSDGHHGKLSAVVRWAGSRPLCWFDDEFQPADEGWAERRSDSGAPTRLIPVDPVGGLQSAHIDTARAFLRQLTGAGDRGTPQ